MEKHYCSLHITAYQGLQRIGAHLDRVHSAPQCSPCGTPLNEEMAPRARSTLQADVQARIEEGYKQSRKLRRDARLALGVIMSGTHERMRAIAFWEERKIQEVLKEACSAYITKQAIKSFKKHVRRQEQQYGRAMMAQVFADYTAKSCALLF